jgi:hypothetical protein
MAAVTTQRRAAAQSSGALPSADHDSAAASPAVDHARRRDRAVRLLLAADALRDAACAAGDAESILTANGARFRARALLDARGPLRFGRTDLFPERQWERAGGDRHRALTPPSNSVRTPNRVRPYLHRGGVGNESA